MRIVVVCTDAGVPVPGDTSASQAVADLVRGFREADHPTFLLGVTGAALPALDGPVMLIANPGDVDPDEREARDRGLSERAVTRSHDVVTRFQPDVVYERLSPFGDAGRRLALRTGATYVVEVERLLSRESASRRGLPISAIEHERELLASADTIVTTDPVLEIELEMLAPTADIRVVPRTPTDSSVWSRDLAGELFPVRVG